MNSSLPSEAFYFPSQAQSNIYNLTYVISENRQDNVEDNIPSKYDLLVAYYRPVADPFANKRCCFIHRFSSNGHAITSVTKHMDFVYLPGASDIVCINALFDELTSEYIVGIGFVKDRDKGYLNIYGSDSLDKLSECCLSFSALSCVPLHLTHTYYISPTTSKLQWAFILSSGNPFGEHVVSSPVISSTNTVAKRKTPVRVIAQLSDTGAEEQNNESEVLGTEDTSRIESNTRLKRTPSESLNTIYGELSVETTNVLFPELGFCPDVKILYMDFRITTARPFMRLAAFGAQNGWIGVCQTDMERCTVLRQFSFLHESAITHVKFFSPAGSKFYTTDAPSLQTGNESPSDPAAERVDLLVCSAFEPSVVYTRILEHEALGLENQLVLPQSADFDHVSCASVGDFNFDGYPEIVLGTFGQRLLFYQWDPLKTAADDDDDGCSSVDGGYRLISQQALIGPIHCISPPLDVAGDGLDAMVVLSGRGLHVYQHCVDDVLDLLRKRIDLSKAV